MVKKIKLNLNEVLKKDLKLLGYLLSFGIGAYFSKKYITDNETLSLIFGGAVNYILFRINQELSQEGYREALKK